MIRTAWQLVTASVLQLLTVEQAKSHLEVTVPDWDADIERRAKSAVQQTEVDLGRGLLTQTWKYAQDIFTDVMWLPMAAPLQTTPTAPVVRYYDTAGTLQVLSTSVYLVDALSEPGRIVLVPGQSWPSTQANRALAVEITYVVGWPTPAAVPVDIVDAVYLRLGTRHAFRESVLAGNGSIASQLPDGIDAMLTPHRVYWREPRLDEDRVAC